MSTWKCLVSGRNRTGEVRAEYKRVAKEANAMYYIGSEGKSVRAYTKDLPIRKEIRIDLVRVTINPETLEKMPTDRAYIHYSKTDSHVVSIARGMKK